MRKQTHAMIAVLRYTFFWLKCFSGWRGPLILSQNRREKKQFLVVDSRCVPGPNGIFHPNAAVVLSQASGFCPPNQFS